jgi:hypothetical protein
LKNSLTKKWLFKDISVTLKAPWVEGGFTSHVADENIIKDLERVKKTIETKLKPPAFAEISDFESPLIFSFKGKAVRMISEGKYWLALEDKTSALLLAGSSSHAIGAKIEVSKGLSPTFDPVGAFQEAFGKPSDKPRISISLSYAFQEIIRPYVESDATWPVVQGLAIFACTIEANRQQLRRVGRGYIRRIVVGSPIYIQQIQS